jgi:proline iminopeptidase
MRQLRFLLLLVFIPICSAQQPAPRTGMVHTPDADLATYSYGPTGSATHGAVPVIVVNGGPGLSHVYLVRNDVWTHRVAEQRLVVLYDQRGTGASKLLRAGAPQSIDAQIADLEAVRASLHAEKVDIAGDSYGGLLAAAYAAAHAEYVNALILSDAATPGIPLLHPRLEEVFPDVVAQTKQQAAALEGQPGAQARIAQLELRAHFRMIFYSQEMYERYMAGSPDLEYNPETGSAVSAAIEKLDLTSQMRQFRLPTLVIEGRYDLNVTPDVAWSVAHMVPGAQLEWFEKSGHLPYYEEADKYVAVVTTFLNSHDHSEP